MVHSGALNTVYEHANACFPRECCGYIRASGQVHKARNIQDDLHRQAPEKNLRDAKGAYAFSPEDVLSLSRGFSSPDPPIIIYHSHPNVGAYFSKKDTEDVLYRGRLIYAVDFLVVDVRNDGAKGAKLFRYINGRFECIWSEEIAVLARSNKLISGG